MRVLIATDGFGGSVDAARLIRRLGLAGGDQIILARASGEQVPAESWDGAERAALADTTASIESICVEGVAQEAVVRAATEWKVDLIAIGPTLTRGASRSALGRLSEWVSRHAPCPVLIGRPLQRELARVVVCVDRSPMAARVVNEACELKLPPAAEVTLVTVVPPQEGMAAIAPVVWSSLPRRVDSLLKAASQEADDRLRSLASLLQSQYAHVRAEVYRGDPATCLTGIVEKERTDLMILGTLGEGGVERLLLGSVSEQVARHVPCSVLLVR